MNRTIKTIVFTLALLATSAFAGELSLQLHGLSWHATSRAEFNQPTPTPVCKKCKVAPVAKPALQWNEANVGLGIRNTFSDDWSIQGGVYRNSVDETTVYAVANYTPLHIGPLRAGGFAGLASGYKKPVIAGGLIEAGPVSVRIIPEIKGVTPLTIGVEIGIKF